MKYLACRRWILRFLEFEHPPAHGFADPHVGAGVLVVVEALVSRGLFRFGEIVAGLDSDDVIFEFLIKNPNARH